MDMLAEIFARQRELNRFTFEKNGLVEFDRIPSERELLNQWLRNYALAMTQEIAELVDILHFWVSACQVMGLSAEDVFRMYAQKNAINAQRQERGYVTKDEGENRTIG